MNILMLCSQKMKTANFADIFASESMQKNIPTFESCPVFVIYGVGLLIPSCLLNRNGTRSNTLFLQVRVVPVLLFRRKAKFQGCSFMQPMGQSFRYSGRTLIFVQRQTLFTTDHCAKSGSWYLNEGGVL